MIPSSIHCIRMGEVTAWSSVHEKEDASASISCPKQRRIPSSIQWDESVHRYVGRKYIPNILSKRHANGRKRARYDLIMEASVHNGTIFDVVNAASADHTCTGDKNTVVSQDSSQVVDTVEVSPGDLVGAVSSLTLPSSASLPDRVAAATVQESEKHTDRFPYKAGLARRPLIQLSTPIPVRTRSRIVMEQKEGVAMESKAYGKEEVGHQDDQLDNVKIHEDVTSHAKIREDHTNRETDTYPRVLHTIPTREECRRCHTMLTFERDPEMRPCTCGLLLKRIQYVRDRQMLDNKYQRARGLAMTIQYMIKTGINYRDPADIVRGLDGWLGYDLLGMGEPGGDQALEALGLLFGHDASAPDDGKLWSTTKSMDYNSMLVKAWRRSHEREVDSKTRDLLGNVDETNYLRGDPPWAFPKCLPDGTPLPYHSTPSAVGV